MNQRDSGFPVRRIVIALESICENLTALEAAAEMAQRMQAELHGIFIEDADLLSAANLHFVKQVTLYSGARSSLDPAEIEREFRAKAERARRQLEDLATRIRVPWSFQVHRGRRTSLIEMTEHSDLLVVAAVARQVAGFMALPSEWPDISLGSGRSCLLLGAPGQHKRGVLAIFDGTAAGSRAIAAALALDGTVHPLTLAVAAGSEQAAAVNPVLQQAATKGGVERVVLPEKVDLKRLLQKRQCALAVVPGGLAGHGLRDLLVAPPCPVLLVN
ncbi:hypothetical protein A8950_1004 [Dongia mobilis]|uniref:Universal stress protein family protein n=1 Tax=Dongia mobilis TaxID=578943 RepID=A0A4V3DF29_9PROT|nr:hypothetical protein [Dongia mobilis]TDQ84451.1 hypothetical protein A8950_1004 [Dongia mobilis]